LAADPEGNIYASAKRNSIVYKFDTAGEMQLKIGKKGKGKGSLPAPTDIATAGSYLIVHDTEKQRLEFLDFEGNYIKNRKISDFADFVIREVDGVKKFYVSHTSPSKYNIDVFGVKTGEAKEGLPGEIADLTEEIAANPDFYLAYNNRGVARYRLEDYQGAIEDFSRTIDLAPDSALSYNNRGLAKVKTKDFDGAVKDFTMAIELDPGNARVFFNRGIALARKEAFYKAIEDFKKAAELSPEMEKKAREQIYFCLSQLKKHFTGSSMPSWR
jgi:tetratricopeptide (TPR) repeat protein